MEGVKDVLKVDPFGKFYEDPMRRLGVLCKNILVPPDQTYRQTDSQATAFIGRSENSLRTSSEFFAKTFWCHPTGHTDRQTDRQTNRQTDRQQHL